MGRRPHLRMLVTAMLKDIAIEASAVVSVALFVGAVLQWAAIIEFIVRSAS